MHTRRKSPFYPWTRILSLLAILGLPGLLPASAMAAERLQVAHSTLTATNSVLWVARDKGIFQRHGLDVRLIYVAGVRSLQALLANEVEIVSVAGSTAVQANVAGADTVIIGGISNSVLMSLIVAPEITTATGLRDGRLAVTRFGSLSDFMARTYLRRAGLTPDRDVALIQTGGYPESVAALQAGAVKGAMLSPPYHKIAMKRLGFRELVDLSRAMKYQSNALVTMRRFAQTRASTVTDFMQSYVEGVRVFKQERDFTIGVLSRAMRTTDREILDDTYSFYRDYFEDIPHPTLEGVQLILEEMAPKFPRAREMRPQDFVDLRFVQALDAARGKKNP